LRIIVGVTGGIAAYKAPSIIRALTELGHDVKVIPTQNALRFVGAATLEAISHNSVDAELFNDVENVKHIALAQEAEKILIAPATASFIARYAAGISDDLLLNVLLATKATVVVAPAMHTEMWEHPATKDNIETLKSRGVVIVEPAVGRLTGSDTGVGRLAEIEDIIAATVAPNNPQDYLGKTVLVVTGGTHEPIDSVRYIGNRSSGKQGLAIAEAAKSRGAQVKLIAVNLGAQNAKFADVKHAETAADVLTLLQSDWAKSDFLIMPAAIGDFSVENVHPGKLHRSDSVRLDLRLVPNPDVLATVAALTRGSNKRPVIVGFAAHASEFEEQNLEQIARSKLIAKQVDVIVANDISNGKIFDSDSNKVLIIGADAKTLAEGTKEFVAEQILDFISTKLNHPL
jgi:phosphopantothenoylcysteine decarboxylase/phosphopantothenate--cysteine ligase